VADGVWVFWVAEAGADGAVELGGVDGIGFRVFHSEAPELMEPQSGIYMP